MKSIHHIVLTGGPCGGKTTAIVYLIEKLTERGFVVLAIPESATICINGGLHPLSKIVGVGTAQKAIVESAFYLENVFRDAAEAISQRKPVVIIYDRGLRDPMAYMDHGEFEKIVSSLGLHAIESRDDRYDAVFHMRTAADGARDFYTLENNQARYETPEQAIVQDDKLIQAWTGHEHVRVIDNRTGFKEKLQRLLVEVHHVLGIPAPVEFERKFLVTLNEREIPKTAVDIDIVQAYLTPIDSPEQVRVRRRGQDGVYNYFKTSKARHSSGGMLELSERISLDAFNMAFTLRDKSSGVIRKTRTCFFHKFQYLELDRFHSLRIDGGDAILEIESTKAGEDVSIPLWMNVVREVTDDPNFSNRTLSLLVRD